MGARRCKSHCPREPTDVCTSTLRGAEHPTSSSKRLCTSGHLRLHGSFSFRDPEALVGCYCLKQWGDPTRDPAQLCHPPSLPPLCQVRGSKGLLFRFCSNTTHSAHPSSVGYARTPNEVSAVDTDGIYASKRFMLLNGKLHPV